MWKHEQEIKVIHNQKVRGVCVKDINGQKYHVDFPGLFCQKRQDELEKLADRNDVLYNPQIGIYQFQLYPLKIQRIPFP